MFIDLEILLYFHFQLAILVSRIGYLSPSSGETVCEKREGGEVVMGAVEESGRLESRGKDG